jgi:hypothetical protein
LKPHLDDALASLSPAQRDAIVGYYLLGRPQAEVAAQLGISEDAMKQRVRYGLDKLRVWFARRDLTASAIMITSGLAAEVCAGEPALAGSCSSAALNPSLFPNANAIAQKVIAMKLIKTSVIAALSVLLTAGLICGWELRAEEPQTVAPALAAAPAIIDEQGWLWKEAPASPSIQTIENREWEMHWFRTYDTRMAMLVSQSRDGKSVIVEIYDVDKLLYKAQIGGKSEVGNSRIMAEECTPFPPLLSGSLDYRYYVYSDPASGVMFIAPVSKKTGKFQSGEAGEEFIKEMRKYFSLRKKAKG